KLGRPVFRVNLANDALLGVVGQAFALFQVDRCVRVMLDAQMIDQRLEHLVQPRFQKKYPAILCDLPPLGRLFAEREQRSLKTLGGLGVLSRKRKLGGYQEIGFSDGAGGLPDFFFVFVDTDVEARHEGSTPTVTSRPQSALADRRGSSSAPS